MGPELWAVGEVLVARCREAADAAVVQQAVVVMD